MSELALRMSTSGSRLRTTSKTFSGHHGSLPGLGPSPSPRAIQLEAGKGLMKGASSSGLLIVWDSPLPSLAQVISSGVSPG